MVRLHGILNGTCNFILSHMEEGAEFAPTLQRAQELGYAEANPTEDVDGFDARAKLVILSRIGLRMQVLPRWRAAEYLQLVADLRLPEIGAIPTQLALMLAVPEIDELDLSCVERIVAGGAASSPTLIVLPQPVRF